MNIQPECVSCIFNQALRITKELGLDRYRSKEVLNLASSFVPKFDLNLTPVENATPMYEEISHFLGKRDLYKNAKDQSIKKAKTFVRLCEDAIKDSQNRFLTATKVAVVGNVIDLASEYEFDLKNEIDKLFERDFAIDDTLSLKDRLKSSKNLVYLADNAGENIFDEIYIKTIKELFSDINIYYFVRSSPIINDITYDDLSADDPIFLYSKVIDSGINTPGVIIENLTKEAKEIFFNADCIISKGMGNYECLSENKELPLYYLMKIKCSVVADSLGRDVGEIICKKS